ncbi:hypothetical protein GCM10027217_03200 [Pseudomaricurvus hydrocarbonicus]
MLMGTEQRGFTLVELLVAMTLGIVLSAGVAVLFLESSTNYSQDDETARMQENGRFAVQLLSHELGMAGFYGRYVNVDELLTTTITDIDQCGDDWAVNVDDHIEHNNDIAATADLYGGCVAQENQTAGSDVLAIKRVADQATLDDGSLQSPATIDDEVVYLRSANQGNELQLVRGASLTVADQTAGSGVDAWEYLTNIYYVRNYSATVGDGIPTLCRVVMQGDGTIGADSSGCLVEGIETIHIEYGDDTDADGVPNQYTDDPAEVDQLVSARVYVMARSVNTVRNYTNDKAYTLGQKTVAAANDRYMRKVYSTTITLRNPFNL